MNYELIRVLKKVKSLSISNEQFVKILNSFNLNENDLNTIDVELDEHTKQESIKKIIGTDEKNFFTVSSHQDFDNLTLAGQDYPKAIILTPLNDHSREYLRQGDVLFCNRIGQFKDLDAALETRGIYGVAFALTEPILLYPNEKGHNQYGVIGYIPYQIKNHLQTRNIQMHPKTNNLTPYNGNRNDTLQYIKEKIHSETLLSLIIEKNKEMKEKFNSLFNTNLSKETLPDLIWTSSVDGSIANTDSIVLEQENFNISAFINDLKTSGLIYSSDLVKRFIASLSAKCFLILTGLSGSGKTQLAYNFAKWITNKNNLLLYTLLKMALKSNYITSDYKIVKFDSNITEVVNIKGNSGKIIALPTPIIYEWYNALKKGIISVNDDPKDKRHTVAEHSDYQKYLHGFYNDLFKISIAMLKQEGSINNTSYKQYVVVPVGADWINREPLLGFQNALNLSEYIKPDNGVIDLILNAINHPENPFFLILDEMNLSHVERYFSDFLSVMETGEKISLYNGNSSNINNLPPDISLPKNLYIIGTVNVDETTYMFSPKVLDRANTIEFTISKNEMDKYMNSTHLNHLPEIDSRGASMAKSFMSIQNSETKTTFNKKKVLSELLKLFSILQELRVEFGYRTINEIIRLSDKLLIVDSQYTDDQIIDVCIIQKVLPKLHGSRNRICPVIVEIAQLCIRDKISRIEDDLLSNTTNYEIVKYPITYKKLKQLYKNAIENGFASFTEA